MSLLTDENYKRLKNTIYVLRASGAKLTPEQQELLRKIERAVTRYELHHTGV